MYDEFRLAFLRELVGEGIDEESMKKVMHVVDRLGMRYEVSPKETSLVPIDAIIPCSLVEYLACRSLEGMSKATLYNYRMTLSAFFKRVQKPLEKIESNDIRGYLYEYQQVRNISNRSLDKIRNTISGFFKWAVAEGKVPKDPTLAVKAIKYSVKPRIALTQLELEYIRKSCGDIRERTIVEILYSTGCRVSELCNMKKEDVDLEDRTIMIFGKGGKYRISYINAKAYVVLCDYLKSRNDNDEHLIVTERKPHRGLSRYMVEKIIGDISDRAYRFTGKHVTPHIFRHTTATVALHNGMPVQNISKMLGHNQLETTMTYAEVDMTDVQRDHNRFVI